MNATVTIAEEFIASPAGEFPHPERRDGPVQVNDACALRTQEAGVSGDIANGRPTVIDDDHASAEERPGWRPLGFVKSARLIPAGLLVNVDWFDHGIETLRLSGQRRVSPCYDQFEQLPGNRIRPLHLHSIGIVRQGNMKSLPTIVNRAGGPLLMNRAMDLPFSGERITNRRAGELFSALVTADQLEHKRSFTDSWNHLRDRYSVLNALMRMPNASQGVLLNRSPFQPQGDAEQAKYWAAVEKAADKVRERLATPIRMYSRETSESAFWSFWDDATRATGGDRRRAFDWIRTHQPEAFGNFVLNSPEAAEFL